MSFTDKVYYDPNTGCHFWTGAQVHGYGSVRINYKHYRAHRAAWEMYRGPIPEGMCVLHKCDTRLCVNPDHLFLGDHADNNLDMMRKGRMHTKLSEEDVRAIRGIVGRTHVDVAREYGVTPEHIGRIRNGKGRVYD